MSTTAPVTDWGSFSEMLDRLKSEPTVELVAQCRDMQRNLPMQFWEAGKQRLEQILKEAGFGKPTAVPVIPLPLVSAASFADQPRPVREYVAGKLFPLRQVSIMAGDGGTGKSLLALQLAAAVSMRALWLGMQTIHGKALYFSAEDDADETHIRLDDICSGEGLDLTELVDLEFAFMAGEDAVLATEGAKSGIIVATPLLARLEAAIARLRPVLVILDNLADIFAGNEILRAQARQFIGMLRKIAMTYDCAVVVLAHPSLSGIASGTGTSGNTAWHNSVRYRCYLKRQFDNPAEITDPDYRKLCTMKDNSGPTGGEIGMRWEAGRFVPTDTAAAATGTIDRMAIASKAERIFLHLVRQFSEQGRNVSASRSSTFAPIVFASHPQSEGVTKRQFEQAMERLFVADRIEVVETGPPSKRRSTIMAKEGKDDE